MHRQGLRRFRAAASIGRSSQKGDSGIYLRGTPQIQIWDPFTSPNTKTGEDKGSGGVFNNQKNPKEPDRHGRQADRRVEHVLDQDRRRQSDA